MNTPSASPAPSGLPRLREVFDALRKGVHLTLAHGELYQALRQNAPAYRERFAELGFDLVVDPRGFAYFSGNDEPTNTARHMAVFILVFIESLASQGLPVEKTLIEKSFTMEDLPHLKGSDRHRQALAQVDIHGTSDLAEKAIRPLVRLGFVRDLGSDRFRFQAPVLRFLDHCRECVPSTQESPRA